MGAKLLWSVRGGVPINETAQIWDVYYPELRKSGVGEAHPRRADDRFDVLMLGGSVLEPEWGTIAEDLARNLHSELGDRFRIFNLARAAHTSRDSLLKYSHLAGKEFDLVIVYDGINDVRMNCCPRESFRDDYSHCGWYRGIERRLSAGKMALPISLNEQFELVRDTIPLTVPDEAQREHGRDIKTARALRRNFEEILGQARARGDCVLLSTFACDIPADYTRERFSQHRLAYDDSNDAFICEAEMWGNFENVIAAVAAQNEAIRELAAARPEVLFVDQDELMPKQKRLFVDPCHLAGAGCRQFVENLWPKVEERLDGWKRTVAARH